MHALQRPYNFYKVCWKFSFRTVLNKFFDGINIVKTHTLKGQF